MQIPFVPSELLAALIDAAGGLRLALVGGAVRDLLMHRLHQDPWRGFPDLDLVVEGSASDVATRLPQSLENRFGRQISMCLVDHRRYGTVGLKLHLPNTFGGTWLLDLASARQDIYATPGCNPDVKLGCLEDDLARRDFTVNAMALDLATGVLLDPHGGAEDLAERQLRFLHPGSLRDDPTRLMRAARYAARLGFALEPDSLRQARDTLAAWPWPWRPGTPPDQAPPALSTRLRIELELLLEREPWRRALAALQAWGGLALLDGALQEDRFWRCRLVWAERLGLPPLLALVAGAEDPQVLAQRLQLPYGQLTWLRQWLGLQHVLARIQCRELPLPDRPSAWCALLEQPGLSAQAVALALVAGAQPRRPLLRWWAAWRHVHAPQDGATLIREGWAPGETLGLELRRRRAEILDGSVQA